MISLLSSAEESIKAFLVDLTSALGFWGTLGVVAGVEALFIIFYAIKSAFSYEARLKRCLDKLNSWLFKVRTINEGNIKRFNSLVKTGPKRIVYYWQQFILYREGGPQEYMTEENLIKKPLQTSSWANNVKNLSIVTYVWAFFSAVIGLAVQASTSTLTVQTVAFSLLFPTLVLVLGVSSVLIIRGTRASNLDEIYHLHHLFIRFIQNACAELPPYIDFNLLFTAKEIDKGNAHLREYYEERTRKAKREFDEARANDVNYVEYKFEDVGVDGTLLLNRAMRESENFINKKTKILSQIAQIDTQKDTLRRNYENVQIDLQRKIQVSKENIKSLIEKQAATTSRIEAQLLKQQQDKEIAKQSALQKDYDQEEARYNSSRAEFDEQIKALNEELGVCEKEVTSGMSSEYQSFFEKVMKNAYVFADKKVEGEKNALHEEMDKREDELVAVQTQLKHLLDENNILRNKLSGYDPKFKQKLKGRDDKYVNGVFVDKDGAFHDENGFFHDKDGRVYNSLGELVSKDETEDEREERFNQEFKEEQVEKFGTFVKEGSSEQDVVAENVPEEAPVEVEPVEQVPQVESQEIPTDATVEGVDFDELFGETTKPQETPVEIQENPQAIEEGLSASELEDLFSSPAPQEEVKTQEPAPIEEAPKEVPAQEPKQEEASKEEPQTPAKKRGRPRKVDAQEVKQEKKRGRPRKTETVVILQAPAKKRGRPRKDTTQNATTIKVISSPTTSQTSAKKRGRPRKVDTSAQEIDSLARITQLIHEEEAKLKNMKSIINSQLDEAIEKASQSKIEEERADILRQVEDLQAQAVDAQRGGRVDEFSTINNQIQILINRLAELNKS